MAGRGNRKMRKPLRLKLARGAVRELVKMGLGREWREVNKALRGKSPLRREVERLCPSTSKLNKVFQSVYPRPSQELNGSVVASFWSSLIYAVSLSENLHKLARVRGGSKREKLRSILALIYDSDLTGLRRQLESLRTDIPRLFEELGGDPSQELFLPPKRSKKH